MRQILKKYLVLLIIPILLSCSALDSKKEDKELKGFYSYMADAALFYECETGMKYPVSFEEDNLALEKDYLEVQKTPGEKILVTLIGHFETKNKMEGTGTEEVLVVTKFLNIWPNVDCTRNLGTANLVNTFWTLRELNGNAIEFSGLEKDIHFLIAPNNKIKGFAGCNDFFGSSYNSNDTIKFNDIESTRKMCIDNMELETELFSALKNIIRYKIYGEYLYLYDEKGLATKFESVYFN